jgi:ribonuclease HI
MNDFANDLVVFTDGSSLGNPGPGGWGAIIISPKLDELVELGGNKPTTTNNEMELTAILSALAYCMHNTQHIHIFTDSQYAMNGIQGWMHGWARNGWQTAQKEPVKNMEIWKNIYDLVQERGRDTITLHHVSGHVGISGNERVDDIARGFGEGEMINLYRGKLSDYHLKDILNIPDLEQARAEKKKTKGKAYSYLSLVDGVFERHSTWSECQKRVSGKDAKYRKATSPEHEKEIKRDWGLE